MNQCGRAVLFFGRIFTLLITILLGGCGVTFLRTEENGVVHAYAFGFIEEKLVPPKPQSAVSGIGLTTIGISAISSRVGGSVALGYAKSSVFEVQNNSEVVVDRENLP